MCDETRVDACCSANLTELFDERFIDHLFTLVERTRLLDDETLNYALIKLIVRPTLLSSIGRVHIAKIRLSRFRCTQVALNEQFMVATLAPTPAASTSASSSHHPHSSSHHSNHQSHHHSRSIDKGKRAAPPPPPLEAAGATEAKKANRILSVLMGRLGASKTFGENMIFMLNRAGESSDCHRVFRHQASLTTNPC